MTAARSPARMIVAGLFLASFASLASQGAPPNPIPAPSIPIPAAPAIPAPPRPPVVSPPSLSPDENGTPDGAATKTPKPRHDRAGGVSGSAAGTGTAGTGAAGSVAPDAGRAASETAGFLSLLGFGEDNPLLRGFSASSASGGKTGTDALLERLIEKMDAGGGSATGAKPPVSPRSAQAVGDGAAKRGAGESSGGESAVEVLRCVVNGHDLERGFSAGFVSTRAKDGSFLVTGERYLVLEGVRRRELVYLLYRPTSATAGRLYVDVSQEVPNEESFFRRLSVSGPLAADAIGDLVVSRASRGDLVADFLFRARAPSVRQVPGR